MIPIADPPARLERRAPVAAIFDKRRELGLRHRRPRDGKGLHVDGVRPLLVVEDERLIGRCTQQETSAPHGHIAGPWSALRPCRLRRAGEPRPGIAQRLAGVGKRFRVHVFVEDAQLDEVPKRFVQRLTLKAVEDLLLHLLQVEQRFQIGQPVRARNINPTGHTRLPRYARGKAGTIHHHHGVYVFPDTNAHFLGENPQNLYSVRFSARELWGDPASLRDSVYLDMWDDYLEPA